MAEQTTQPTEIDRNQPVEIPATPDAVREESPQTPATEEAPTEATKETSENSSSTEEDLSALIEAERNQGKPDPEKARQRYLESQQKKQEETVEDYSDPEEQPLTRKQIEEIMASERAELFRQANESQIETLATSLAESPQEAELIKEVHKNRVFPAGMSLRDQMQEAHAIATYKRTQAKATELARAVQHQQTASRNTATTHRDPQTAGAPKLSADMEASLKRAGFVYSGEHRRYEKKLPNGKTLVRDTNGSQFLAD